MRSRGGCGSAEWRGVRRGAGERRSWFWNGIGLDGTAGHGLVAETWWGMRMGKAVSKLSLGWCKGTAVRMVEVVIDKNRVTTGEVENRVEGWDER